MGVWDQPPTLLRLINAEVIVKTLTRPITVVEPPAEGDWQIVVEEAGDDE